MNRCHFFGNCNKPEPESPRYCSSVLYKSCEYYRQRVQERLGRMRNLEVQAERLKRLGGYYK